MGLDKIAKLKGRENFDTWKFAAKSYLVIKGYWPCMLGNELSVEKNLQAISALGLLLEPCNYSYVQNCSSAKEAWEALEKAFEDNGVMRRMDLLKYFTRLEYSDCTGMEDYVNKMTTTHQKLSKSGTNIPDDICAQIMLSGLPDQYRPMVMAIANCGKNLTTDLVRTNLLQEIGNEPSNDEALALFSKKGKKKTGKINNKNIVCFECNKKGHYANKCPSKNKNTLLLASTSFVAKTNSTNEWFIDSGATAHMTMSKNNLTHMIKPTSIEVIVGDNGRLAVECTGDVHTNFNNGDTFVLKDVQYIPNICANLISVSQMAKHGKTITFNKDICRVFDENKRLIITAPLVNGLYKLNGPIAKIDSALTMSTDHELWHRRMGHVCETNLKRIKNATTGTTFSNKALGTCTVCVKGKITRASFKSTGTRATECLQLIHTDVCGPLPTQSFGGARFFLTFVDDFSRKVFVYTMKKKSDVFNIFVKFKNLVENQQDYKIKTLRSDNGKEYCNHQFSSFLAEHGIVHQCTAPYTPEQNGVAERMNRSLLEKARCMLIDANLRKQFWAEAVNTAAFLMNRIPCRNNDITPEEIWSKLKPDLNFIKLFGCKAMVHIPKEQRGKLDAKAIECILIGFCENSKAYKLYNFENKKIIISAHVTFFEHDNIHKNTNTELTNNCSLSSRKGLRSATQMNNDLSTSETSDSDDSEGNDIQQKNLVKPPCSPDALEPNEEYHDTTDINFDETNNEHIGFSEGGAAGADAIKNPVHNLFVTDFEVQASEMSLLNTSLNNSNLMTEAEYIGLLAATADQSEPCSMNDALNGSDGKKWAEAMDAEVTALEQNGTWELTDLPPGRKAIDSKWVFKIKRNATGEVERYKARLVIKGYSQVKGIDYDETYSPVVRYASLRLLIAMAAKFDLSFHQMDAVTAFLQGELEEEIFMRQPEYINDGTNKVCRLRKCLYGLKQASRVWNSKLNNVLTNKLGFNRSAVDQCIYFRHSDINTIILAVYVDDILIFGSNNTMISKLKKNLSTYFKMKDMGAATSVLGMNIQKNEDGSISIDQSMYITSVLERFKMTDCNPISTPMDPNQKLTKDMCPRTEDEQHEMKSIPYQEAIGCIMYAAQISRPDISYAVSSLSRYNTNYGKAHWSAVKRVLRYLKGTVNMKLTYKKEDMGDVIGYCDADWAGDQDDRRSTTGYVFKLQDGAISWATRRQPTIALSSTEAEFMSMVAAIQEAIWIKNFETEIFLRSQKSLTLLCDNQGAIQLAKNNHYHSRTKHIDVRHYFIREKLAAGMINLNYLSTNEMAADILTKAVSQAKLNKFIEQYGLKNTTS